MTITAMTPVARPESGRATGRSGGDYWNRFLYLSHMDSP